MAVLYRHIRLDKNQPFYIGIGRNVKRAYNQFHRNNIWNKITKKTKYEVEIILDNLTWAEAQEKEKEFISMYGRIDNGGILCNLTDGGDGTLGYKLSDETKEKIANKQKQRLSVKFNHGMYGKKHSESSIEKNRKSNQGVKSFLFGKKGESHPRYKKPISDSQKKKIIESNIRRSKINESLMAEIMKELEVLSVVEVSKKYSVSFSTIYRKLIKIKDDIHNRGQTNNTEVCLEGLARN